VHGLKPNTNGGKLEPCSAGISPSNNLQALSNNIGNFNDTLKLNHQSKSHITPTADNQLQ